MVIVAIVGLILLAIGLGLFAYVFYITAGGFRTRESKTRNSPGRALTTSLGFARLRTGPKNLGETDIMELRILIVDDSEITRRILGTLVRSRHWTVCGEAENGWSSVKKFQELKPDVVLLDLAMPDINGIETAKQMSASDPRVPLILFTICEIEGIESAAREAGIRAIVPKTEAWNLLGSIESLVNGGSSPQIP
jgi:two-component system chemotaxis response regulator CheY